MVKPTMTGNFIMEIQFKAIENDNRSLVAAVGTNEALWQWDIFDMTDRSVTAAQLLCHGTGSENGTAGS